MSTSEDDAWLFVRGTRGDSQMIARLRRHGPTDAERAEMPMLVMIRWTFGEEDEVVPLDEDEIASMGDFEESLFTAMDLGGWGKGMAVLSCEGVREWRIYTQDIERFQEGLNDALAGRPRYPLEFEILQDPYWHAYGEIAATVQGTSGRPD